MILQIKNQCFYCSPSSKTKRDRGFTLIEVLIAASIMIILCVGVLSVFSYVVKINRGENIRTQAQSVLQQEIEHYRGLKFVPGLETQADLDSHRAPELRGNGSGLEHPRPPRTSAEEDPTKRRTFNITATVKNVGYRSGQTADEAHCTLKEIEVKAELPEGQETGWLANANLKTKVTILRVRSN